MSSRTSGRAYRPDEPENRHGTRGDVEGPQDRVGVAVGANEDRVVPGAAPSAIRRAMSAAIQSASSDPVANASSRTGAGAGPGRWARSRFDRPVRTSRRSGSLNRISR